MSKLLPLGNKIVLKPLPEEKTTTSGIILPGQENTKPQCAEVIAVGPDVDNINAGSTVIYSKYAGTDVKVDNEDYIIVKSNDILAILSDKE